MTKMEKRGRASTEKGWERKGYDQKEDKIRNINNKLKKEYAVRMRMLSSSQNQLDKTITDSDMVDV